MAQHQVSRGGPSFAVSIPSLPPSLPFPAISGDYVPAIIELNFAPGENEKFVSVMILNDDVFEGPEVFHGLLIPISLGVAIGGSAIVTIDDSADGELKLTVYMCYTSVCVVYIGLYVFALWLCLSIFVVVVCFLLSMHLCLLFVVCVCCSCGSCI